MKRSVPIISVIIPAYNIENFIEQALHSCLQPLIECVEFIIIDDRSTDSTAMLVDRFIHEHGARYDFKLIRKDVNQGLGMARNTGLDHARGDYIMFLDGDDWLASNILSRVVNIIKNNQPDLIIFDYARVFPNGKVVPSAAGDALAQRLIGGIEEKTNLIGLFHVAWTKVYKRSFIESIGIRFPSGLYEDIPWTYPIILLASRIFVDPIVGVYYRQRDGSITRSVGKKHFDVIVQCRALLEILSFDKSGGGGVGCFSGDLPPEIADALYLKVKRQLFYVVESGRISSLRDRLLYFKLALNLLRDYRERFLVKKADRDVKVYVSRGLWYFMAYFYTRKYRNRIRSWLKMCKRLASESAQSIAVVNGKKVLFESYWGAKADGNPLALAHELNKRGDYDIVWSFADLKSVPRDFPWRTVKRRSLKFYFEAATSGLLVNPPYSPECAEAA